VRLATKIGVALGGFGLVAGGLVLGLLANLLSDSFAEADARAAEAAAARAHGSLSLALESLSRSALRLTRAAQPALPESPTAVDPEAVRRAIRERLTWSLTDDDEVDYAIIDVAGRNLRVTTDLDDADVEAVIATLLPTDGSESDRRPDWLGEAWNFRLRERIAESALGPLVGVAAEIRPGADTPESGGRRDGAPLVRIVLARRLSDRILAVSADAAGGAVRVVDADGPELLGAPASARDGATAWVADAGTVAAAEPLAPRYGPSNLVLVVERPRAILQQGAAALVLVLAMLAAAGALGIAGFIAALRGLVLRRIARLARYAERVRDAGEVRRDLADDSSDEIGRLVRAIEAMLDRLDDQALQLRASNRELLTALQVKDEFLNAVSHELRTPLTTIIGFTGELSRAAAPPGGARADGAVAHISRAGQHLLELIDELLTLARTRAGRLEFAAGPVDLHDVIDDAAGLVAGAARAAGIAVEPPDPDAEIPPVRADHRRLVQVVVNLIGNAVKFCPPGSRVVVSAGRRRSAGEDGRSDWIRLSVVDDGPGIPAAQRDRIFEPFVRLTLPPAPGRDAQSGTGLGLALVREFVERMGGRVTAEAARADGTGAAFHVDLAPMTDEAGPA
jgi:signal transduction histidine kinase